MVEGIHSCYWRRAQFPLLLAAPLDEDAPVLVAVPEDEELPVEELGDVSVLRRSPRCCLRSIKTCTRSSSVSCRARLRSLFLRRSALRRSFANFIFCSRSSFCFALSLWIDADKASSGNASLMVTIAEDKPTERPMLEVPGASLAGALTADPDPAALSAEAGTASVPSATSRGLANSGSELAPDMLLGAAKACCLMPRWVQQNGKPWALAVNPGARMKNSEVDLSTGSWGQSEAQTR